MTCAPQIRADAGSIPPRPTLVRLAAAARGGKAVAGRTAGPTPAEALRSVGTAACLRMSAPDQLMADMLDPDEDG
jgi:hypothetical protein